SLEGLRAVLRYSRIRVDRYAAISQQIQARREAGHDIDAIRAESRVAATRREKHIGGLDGTYPAVPPHRDLALLHAVGEIGQNPWLDLLVERRPEMHQRHPRSRPPQVESCFGC